jgi:hypothetical protein
MSIVLTYIRNASSKIFADSKTRLSSVTACLLEIESRRHATAVLLRKSFCVAGDTTIDRLGFHYLVLLSSNQEFQSDTFRALLGICGRSLRRDTISERTRHSDLTALMSFFASDSFWYNLCFIRGFVITVFAISNSVFSVEIASFYLC